MSKKTDDNSDKVRELGLLVNDLEAKWKRALADYQNLEKRVKEEKVALAKFASESLIAKLLPVLDDLEKAAFYLRNEGLNLALKHLEEVLEKEGLEKIAVLGKNFDPETMEAIQTVEGEEENKVKKELRPGYKLNGRVIRFAQVQVEKKVLEKNAEEKVLDQLPKGEYM